MTGNTIWWWPRALWSCSRGEEFRSRIQSSDSSVPGRPHSVPQASTFQLHPHDDDSLGDADLVVLDDDDHHSDRINLAEPVCLWDSWGTNGADDGDDGDADDLDLFLKTYHLRLAPHGDGEDDDGRTNIAFYFLSLKCRSLKWVEM